MALNVAVVGVGYLGKHHARIYSGLDDVRLVAVCDPDSEAAERAASEYGCEGVSDYKDVLKDVDALSIVTPTSMHFDISLECIRAGKHLLIEKPITTTVAEADELIKEATRSGSIIQVGHLERYNPAVVEVHKMIDEPCFIESQRVAPFQPRGTDVDVTLDLMIHDIDIVLSMLGSPEIKDIRVMGMKVLTEKLDIARAWMEFEGGAKALVTASRVAQSKERSLRLHQKDSFVHVDYMNMSIMHSWVKGDEIATESVDIPVREPLKDELEDFASCVSAGRVPHVTAPQGKQALEIALDITNKINEMGCK